MQGIEYPFLSQTFCKAERLCSKKAIETLFDSGIAFYVSPIKVLVLKSPSKTPKLATVLISVPKKHLRKAYQRNRMKRLLREAYRRKKIVLNESMANYDYSLALIFTGKRTVNFQTIENAVDKILQNIIELEIKIIGLGNE